MDSRSAPQGASTRPLTQQTARKKWYWPLASRIPATNPNDVIVVARVHDLTGPAAVHQARARHSRSGSVERPTLIAATPSISQEPRQKSYDRSGRPRGLQLEAEERDHRCDPAAVLQEFVIRSGAAGEA